MMLVESQHQPQQPTCGSSSSLSKKKTIVNDDENPLSTDQELQSLLKVAKNIHSVGIFTRWFTTFLEKLNNVSSNMKDVEGAHDAMMDKANRSNGILLQQIQRMNKILQIISKVMMVYKKTQNSKSQEELDAFRTKLQNATHRLKDVCLGGVKQLRHFVPSNDTKDTVAGGYNQFQWMSVQFTNGFEVYGHLLWQYDTLQAIQEQLQCINDDDDHVVVVDAIHAYQDQIRSICNTILTGTAGGDPDEHGLFPIMMKMRDFEGDTSFDARAQNMIELLLQGDNNDTSDSSSSDDDEPHHQDATEGSLPDLLPMKTSASTTATATTTTAKEEEEDHTCTTDDDVSQSENSSSSS